MSADEDDRPAEGRRTGPEHYFSAAPESAERRRQIAIRLDGRDLQVLTATGVFSRDRLDPGTAVLLRHALIADHGDLLDLGCGWGALTLAMALRAPAATVWAIDVNERALQLTRENARRLGLADVRVCSPDDVPPQVQFSTIWSNPPVRIGKAALHALLQRWLPRLTPGGTAWLVVQRNLGADSLQAWVDEQFGGQRAVRRAGSAKGYRVISVGPLGAAGPGHRDRC